MKDETPRKYSRFLCNRPHRVFECLKRGKLAALVMENERHDEEISIASMSLLSVIPPNVGEQSSSHMYVETVVKGKKLRATGDIGAGKVYMAKELTDEISLPYKKRKGLCEGSQCEEPPNPRNYLRYGHPI